MQRDLHLIYKQIPAIWIKAGKPTSDIQKGWRKKDRVKSLQSSNSAHRANKAITPAVVRNRVARKEVSGNIRNGRIGFSKEIQDYNKGGQQGEARWDAHHQQFLQ